MRRIYSAALVLAGTLAACTEIGTVPEFQDVLYATDRATYTASDTIVVQLANRTRRMIGFNLCISRLERYAGVWSPTGRRGEHVCTLQLDTRAPGGEATYREPASRMPGAGTYRLRTVVESPVGGRRIDVATPPFTIAP